MLSNLIVFNIGNSIGFFIIMAIWAFYFKYKFGSLDNIPPASIKRRIFGISILTAYTGLTIWSFLKFLSPLCAMIFTVVSCLVVLGLFFRVKSRIEFYNEIPRFRFVLKFIIGLLLTQAIAWPFTYLCYMLLLLFLIPEEGIVLIIQLFWLSSIYLMMDNREYGEKGGMYDQKKMLESRS